MPILDRYNPILRQKSAPVPAEKIGKPEISRVIAEMKSVLAIQDDAVAIAAPQIGAPLRIFVVAGRVLSALSKKNATGDGVVNVPDQTFINPEIIKRSRKKDFMEEGCLSVRWLYGKVRRSQSVTVKARDELGAEITRGASGLLAQIFQHEIDHLDGILFVDSAKYLIEIPPRAKNHE
jgi:peptide deformylase